MSPESKNSIKEKRGGARDNADIKNKIHKGSDDEDQKDIKDNEDEEDDTDDDSNTDEQDAKPKRLSFLEVLPSPQGTALAADLANILTMGMNAQQENIFGNFLAAVASLILYKASRDELTENAQKD